VQADGFRLWGRLRYCSVDSERTNMFSGLSRYVSVISEKWDTSFCTPLGAMKI